MAHRLILILIAATLSGCVSSAMFERPDGTRQSAGPGTSAASITATSGDDTLDGVLTMAKDVDATGVYIETRGGSTISIDRWTSGSANGNRVVEGLGALFDAAPGIAQSVTAGVLPIRQSSDARRVSQQQLRTEQVRERAAVAAQRAEQAKLQRVQAEQALAKQREIEHARAVAEAAAHPESAE